MTPSGKKYFKFVLILLFLVGIFLGCYLIYLVQGLPFDRLERVSETLNIGPKQYEKIKLEEGSNVNMAELRNYYNFSSGKRDFKNWLDDLIENLNMRISGKNILVLEEVEIPGLFQNTCKKIYCYQHKLKFDYIPSVFWKGLIGIEDIRFLDHFGIDIKSILRAIVHDIKALRFVQGGSTLTQQLVKNLFLTSKRSLNRKLREVILSFYIEYKLKKEDILEAYFNEVYWGSLQGFQVRGIYAASLFYFDKKISKVSPYEAAILISLLKGPGFYGPIRHLERLKKRTKLVYKKLIELKLFSQNTKYAWSEKKWDNWHKALIKRNKFRPYYSLALKKGKDKKQIMNQYENYVLIKKIQELLNKIKFHYKKGDFAAKILIGIPHKLDSNYYKFYSKVEQDIDKSFEKNKNQVGSILKPILYSIFSENNISFDEEISTDEIILKLKSGKWSPREAHKNLPEKITLREALLKSYNRPVIKLAQRVGFDLIENKLKEYIPDLLTPLREYPAQLLGAVELSMEEIYNIYKKFIIEQCENFRMKQEVDNLPLFILASPENTTIRKVVGPGLKKINFFGKTGTSNNGLNNWFVFYDGYYLGIIWVGHEGARQGIEYRLFGSTTSFQIFQGFFQDRGKTFNELSCDKLVKEYK